MMNSRKLQTFKLVYGSVSDKELARRFGITVRQVPALAKRSCLRNDKRFAKRQGIEQRMPRWSDEEIARALGRSIKSVVSQASRLGLMKSGERLSQTGRQDKSRQR